jgi:hypothetical protein
VSIIAQADIRGVGLYVETITHSGTNDFFAAIPPTHLTDIGQAFVRLQDAHSIARSRDLIAAFLDEVASDSNHIAYLNLRQGVDNLRQELLNAHKDHPVSWKELKGAMGGLYVVPTRRVVEWLWGNTGTPGLHSEHTLYYTPSGEQQPSDPIVPASILAHMKAIKNGRAVVPLERLPPIGPTQSADSLARLLSPRGFDCKWSQWTDFFCELGGTDWQQSVWVHLSPETRVPEPATFHSYVERELDPEHFEYLAHGTYSDGTGWTGVFPGVSHPFQPWGQ